MPKISFGLEIGNQWYVWRTSDETMGVAINVNWFDFQIGSRKMDVPFFGSMTNRVINFSFLEFGPMYTYAVNDEIGLDGYLNLKPTVLAGVSTGDNVDSSALVGLGFTYALGANFRWRALLVGLEYGFGKVKVADTDNTDFTQKVNTGMFKINLGVKL